MTAHVPSAEVKAAAPPLRKRLHKRHALNFDPTVLSSPQHTTHQPQPPTSSSANTNTLSDTPPADSANESKLLTLPPELLGQITDNLNLEVLSTVRLTCKALDSVTLDRFADKHFSHVYCWIGDDAAFKRLKAILNHAHAQRIRARIREVTFTVDILEDKSSVDIQSFARQSPIYHISNSSSAASLRHASQAYALSALYQLSNVMNMRPDRPLVNRVLLDLQKLPQDVKVDLDLSGSDEPINFSYHHRTQVHGLLFFIVTKAAKLHRLTNDYHSHFDAMADIFGKSHSRFLASVRELKLLELTHERYVGIFPTHKELFKGIFGAAKGLEILKNKGGRIDWCQWSDLTNLTELALMSTELGPPHDIVQRLEHLLSRSKITKLKLQGVDLCAAFGA